MVKILKNDIFKQIPSVDENKVDELLAESFANFNKKIIVLDDDPTGVQTIHDVSVYTDWSATSIAAGFAESRSMFFILTNSRAFSAEHTKNIHEEIAQRIIKESKKTGRDFMIISRSDSTLRGHYPLETKVLRDTLENGTPAKIDGEILMPFFKEGGRYTIGNIHYVQEGAALVPAGETEFAKDKTFGYKASDMRMYVEEKTHGEYKAKDTVCISLDDLRKLSIDSICHQLMQVNDFNKVIVNAIDYVDVRVFTAALLNAMKAGKNFMFRTAAAFTKVIGNISDKPLLSKKELVTSGNKNGGLIIIGSHVQKTTEQLNALKKDEDIKFIEFNHLLVLDPPQLEEELIRIIKTAEISIRKGQTVAVFTGRTRLDAGSEEESLRFSVKISEAITNIVSRLSIQPSFLIAKGGITSSDVGTKGLSVKHALVLGQVAPGIPVWKTGSESKFPDMSYIIFPGNVGAADTLYNIVRMLSIH
ncbi:four-carbon acid sugar kinase family protein [Pectinatus haikarae]|uniref:four-carbon acid sugar kinase family protein n=1 Tax=Pectinatus haikarae TaxID=349096 RepID=UPI0018C59995|nr:four-carbon acid sugar kinase family protein [Pectinatus haikarae]